MAMEVWQINTTKEITAEFLLPIAKNGNYNITFRYWDGLGGNNMAWTLDGNLLTDINIKGLNEPQNHTVIAEQLTSGIHILKVNLKPNQANTQFAALDYIEILSADVS
jgi:hypothetical protein